MYFTLCAVFWYENFKVTLKPRLFLMVIFAVIVPIIFSGVMEYLQYMLTSYRTGDLVDFYFNTMGILVAVLFSWFVTRPLMKRRSRRCNGDEVTQ
jgi:VanZ family protein